MKQDKIITRFAPSPTGYIHIGNVRAAIFPWLLARQTNGKFIVRIEDTDRTRYVEGATELILETLTWLGLDWDEGPQVGGDNGPYFQTERKEIYLKWAQKLIDKGLAYPDPYTPEQLDEFRAEARALKRPFLYRNYRPTEFSDWDGKTALRFKVPEVKKSTWHDQIMGDLSAGEDALDDFIIIKSDGLPTYNFAHIIDDYEMGVNLILRGAEYISSIPKYLALYQALEIEPPKMGCMPHIMAPSGNKKLSKRDGTKSVTDYRQDGILPETMLNFLTGLGWNDGTEQEVFSRQELIDKFSLDRVQKSGARFDEKRLLWLNGQWIKKLDLEKLADYCQDFWGPAGAKQPKTKQLEILELVRSRMKTLTDLPSLSEYLFTEPEIDWSLVDNDKKLKKLSRAEHRQILQTAYQILEQTEFSQPKLLEAMNKILEATKTKPNVGFSIVRFALTWAPFSPNLDQMMAILGKETVLARIKLAINN